MSLADFKNLMLPAIESELEKNINSLKKEGLFELYHICSYQLGWTGEGAGPKTRGKRVRPLLLLLTTATAGGNWKLALPGAAAVELVHNFSLVHDDIQDESPLRRGRETIWKTWGIAQGINVGDSIYSLAHIALKNLDKLVPVETAIKVHHILPNACLTLTMGQYLDLSFEKKKDVSISDYWQMIKGKTASLLSTCTEIGAILANVDVDTQSHYREFGQCIGLAFQVQDDILGIWGDAAITGKSSESDILTGKKSLPVLYGLQKSELFAKKWNEGNFTPEDVSELANILESEGAFEYSKSEVDKFTQQALDWFMKTNPKKPESDALIDFVTDLIHRKT